MASCQHILTADTEEERARWLQQRVRWKKGGRGEARGSEGNVIALEQAKGGPRASWRSPLWRSLHGGDGVAKLTPLVVGSVCPPPVGSGGGILLPSSGGIYTSLLSCGSMIKRILSTDSEPRGSNHHVAARAPKLSTGWLELTPRSRAPCTCRPTFLGSGCCSLRSGELGRSGHLGTAFGVESWEGVDT